VPQHDRVKWWSMAVITIMEAFNFLYILKNKEMIAKYKPGFVVMLRHEASLNRIEATFYFVVLPGTY
jgi:hypothetical protein